MQAGGAPLGHRLSQTDPLRPVVSVRFQVLEPRSLQPIVSDTQPNPTAMYPTKVTNARIKPQHIDTATSFTKLDDRRKRIGTATKMSTPTAARYRKPSSSLYREDSLTYGLRKTTRTVHPNK